MLNKIIQMCQISHFSISPSIFVNRLPHFCLSHISASSALNHSYTVSGQAVSSQASGCFVFCTASPSWNKCISQWQNLVYVSAEVLVGRRGCLDILQVIGCLDVSNRTWPHGRKGKVSFHSKVQSCCERCMGNQQRGLMTRQGQQLGIVTSFNHKGNYIPLTRQKKHPVAFHEM